MQFCVVANKTALLGSVGVVVGVGKGKGEEEIVSSQSPYKRVDPATAEGRARIQATVDNLAAIFIADVAKYRGAPKSAFAAPGSTQNPSDEVAIRSAWESPFRSVSANGLKSSRSMMTRSSNVKSPRPSSRNAPAMSTRAVPNSAAQCQIMRSSESASRAFSSPCGASNPCPLMMSRAQMPAMAAPIKLARKTVRKTVRKVARKQTRATAAAKPKRAALRPKRIVRGSAALPKTRPI